MNDNHDKEIIIVSSKKGLGNDLEASINDPITVVEAEPRQEQPRQGQPRQEQPVKEKKKRNVSEETRQRQRDRMIAVNAARIEKNKAKTDMYATMLSDMETPEVTETAPKKVRELVAAKVAAKPDYYSAPEPEPDNYAKQMKQLKAENDKLKRDTKMKKLQEENDKLKQQQNQPVAPVQRQTAPTPPNTPKATGQRASGGKPAFPFKIR